MMSFTDPYFGVEGGPPAANAYKRAVYKQPPANFTIDMLPPQKQGNNYSYGMHIFPIRTTDINIDRRSTISNTSSGSSSSMSEYEIWRRWEDCLHFQDTLEAQYSIMAREKRTRLAAGKGVRKNGVYPHEDPTGHEKRAASFESLPPGPDPHMIAKDVHDFLPRLSKKGTLFRASSATVEQRSQEFSALIKALWREGEDVPTLIIELRELRIIRDFFGHWRRDRDRADKEKSARAKADSSAASISPSTRSSAAFGSSFGMIFSASNLSLQLPTSLPIPDAQLPTKNAPLSGKKSVAHGDSHGRPRPNTSQGIEASRAVRASTATTIASSSSSTDSQIRATELAQRPPQRGPPASAPAGVTFTFTMANSSDEDPDQDGYLSESVSIDTQPPPRSPRAAYPHGRSFPSPTSPHDVSGKGKGKQEILGSEPIIVTQDQENFGIPIDEDDEQEQQMILREHEHLIPHTLDPLFESYEQEEQPPAHEIDFRIQSLTIDEEGPDAAGSTIGEQEIADQGSGLIEDEPLPEPIPRVTRRNGIVGAPAANRNGLIFMSPAPIAVQTDEDDVSSCEGNSSAADPPPRVPSRLARQPLPHIDSAATISPAHVTPSLSAGSISSVSPTTTRFFTPGPSSRRSSWASSIGNVANSEAHLNLNGTKRPQTSHSHHSSATSFGDFDNRVSSSPIVLHTPLYDKGPDADLPVDVTWRHHPQHDSISSMKSFLTDCSADAIIPRRTSSPTPSKGASLRRSLSANSRRPIWRDQISGLPIPADPSESWSEEGEALIDSYLYGPTSSPPATPSEQSPVSSTFSGREHVRGSFATPDAFPKPFRNRPPGQFHLPWTPTTPTTPSISRSSISSSAPSSAALEDCVAIKAILDESIVVFRAERAISLGEVRERLHDKFVIEQGMPLADSFVLGYVPRAHGPAGRRATGRARSCSVSSAGTVDDSQLQYIFSQVEWQEAIAACGTKVTLRVLNGSE